MSELTIKKSAEMLLFEEKFLMTQLKSATKRTAEELFRIGGIIWFLNEENKKIKVNWSFEKNLLPLLESYGFFFSANSAKNFINVFVTSPQDLSKCNGIVNATDFIEYLEEQLQNEKFLPFKSIGASTALFGSELLKPNENFLELKNTQKVKETLRELIKTGEFQLEEFAAKELKEIREKITEEANRKIESERAKIEEIARKNAKAELEEILKNKTKELEKTNEKISEAEELNKALKRELKEAMENNNEEKTDELKKELLKVNSELDVLSIKYIEDKKRLKDLENEKEDLESEKENLESELYNKELELQQKAQVAEMAKQAIENFEKEKRELQQKFEREKITMKKAFEDAEKQIKSLQSAVNKEREAERLANTVLKIAADVSEACSVLGRKVSALMTYTANMDKIKRNDMLRWRIEKEVKATISDLLGLLQEAGIEGMVQYSEVMQNAEATTIVDYEEVIQ